jgi:peptidoglycan/LPS O-acetylase OafA/YrhL
MQMETHYRFDALAWGCMVWIHQARLAAFWQGARQRRLLEVAVVVAAVVVCVPMPASPLGQSVAYLLMAPIFAALVSALAFARGFWLDKVLAWAPLALVGVVSYEIYLTHVIVFRVLARLHLDRWLDLYYAVCFALSIAVGWLFHRLFGKPTQRVVRGWISPKKSPAPAPEPA